MRRLFASVVTHQSLPLGGTSLFLKPFRLSIALLFVIAVFGYAFLQLEKWSAEVASPDFNDADLDGMDDTWEAFNRLDPRQRDGAKDLDVDDLTNLQEFRLHLLPRRADTDRDGMSDGWEVLQRFDPHLDDGALDADGDGLSNLGEFRSRTNPHLADSDGDSMPDGWEVTYKTNPLSKKDTTMDFDEDGRNTLQEYRAGTDPTDYFDGVAPLITVLSGERNPDGEFKVKVHKADGTPYRNAPVTFDVPPEEASFVGNPDSTIYHQHLILRTDSEGTARVYLRPPVGQSSVSNPPPSQIRVR